MQQTPRFTPFGPWKPPTTSTIPLSHYRPGLAGFMERYPPEVLAPYNTGGVPPPPGENPFGNNATSFALMMKFMIMPEMPRSAKWRDYWYRPRTTHEKLRDHWNRPRATVASHIGLGGFSNHYKPISKYSTSGGANTDHSAPLPPFVPVIPEAGKPPQFPPRSAYGELSPAQAKAIQASGSRIAQVIDFNTYNDVAPPKAHDDQCKDDELKITIGGRTGFLSWDHVAQTSDLYSFFQKRRAPASNSLFIEWHDSAVDQTGARGRTTLKLLFRYLNKPFPFQTSDVQSPLCPLSTLSRISIKVPKVVKDLESINLLGQITQQDDSIDLKSAYHVQQLFWSGEFGIFALKYSNIPLASLVVLSLTECLISTDDAIAIAHSCTRLRTLTLETITPPEQTDLGDLVKPSLVDVVDFPCLTSLTIKCTARHEQLLNRMSLTNIRQLVVHLDNTRLYEVDDFDIPTIPWSQLQKLAILGTPLKREVYNYLQDACRTRVDCDVCF